jgi:glutaredoxin
MKAIVYTGSWCSICRSMVDYLQEQYAGVQVQLIPLDRVPAEAREKALAALRKLTWSDQLPVTLLDDTVILGADYKALAAILGQARKAPPAGNAQHRHGLDEAAA